MGCGLGAISLLGLPLEHLRPRLTGRKPRGRQVVTTAASTVGSGGTGDGPPVKSGSGGLMPNTRAKAAAIRSRAFIFIVRTPWLPPERTSTASYQFRVLMPGLDPGARRQDRIKFSQVC